MEKYGTAFPTVTLGVDSCSAVVCAALSEREAVAGSPEQRLLSHRRPSWVHGWQSLPVWPPIKDKFTLLCWKKKERKDNLHHSSAQLWQRRKSMFEIWPYHHCVTVALACHFMHAAWMTVSVTVSFHSTMLCDFT